MNRSADRPHVIKGRGAFWLVLDGKLLELSFKTLNDLRAFTATYISATTNEERHAAIDSIIVSVAETR